MADDDAAAATVAAAGAADNMDTDTPAAAAGGSRGGIAGPGPGSSSSSAAAAGAAGSSRGGGSGRSSKRKKLYAQHKTAAEIAAGVAAGRVHQGTLRASRFNPFEGWVASESVGQDILISGRIDMNRAIDGELLMLL
jgi:exosome complex exonuclease DIS3/RRP44